MRNAGLPVGISLAERSRCCIKHFDGCMDDAFEKAAQEAHDRALLSERQTVYKQPEERTTKRGTGSVLHALLEVEQICPARRDTARIFKSVGERDEISWLGESISRGQREQPPVGATCRRGHTAER